MTLNQSLSLSLYGREPKVENQVRAEAAADDASFIIIFKEIDIFCVLCVCVVCFCDLNWFHHLCVRVCADKEFIPPCKPKTLSSFLQTHILLNV